MHKKSFCIGKEEDPLKFENYFAFSIPVNFIKSHQVHTVSLMCTHIQVIMYTYTRYCEQMYRILFTHVQVIVYTCKGIMYTCTGFYVHMYILYTVQLTGYCVHMCRLLCRHVQVIMCTCTLYTFQ